MSNRKFFPAPSSPCITTAVRSFGPYTLIRLIGSSSLTIAWLARDTRTDQPVRLLILGPGPAGLAATPL